MDEAFDRIDPERAWAAATLALFGGLVAGAVAFPRRVYDGFIWRYFWGPVVADGTGSRCAERMNGETILHDSAADCQAAIGIVAEPGYTTVSTASYAIVLILALVGVMFLLRRLEIGHERGFFFALFPFMLFGGALRTVEDANVALLRETGEMVLPFPWTGLIISPLIYFTVFFIALAALLLCAGFERRGLVDRYEYPLFGIGAVAVATVLAFLGWLATTTGVIGFNPAVPVITLVGATLLTAVVWVLTERVVPEVNRGTGYMGALIVWGHTVDGIANVLSLDWAHLFGLPGYAPKHVVNSLIIEITGAVQPPEVSQAIGTAWPFLFVKIAAAVVVVWIFDEPIFEESPRYALLLLVTILAVGLGPGTRDFLRATFGI